MGTKARATHAKADNDRGVRSSGSLSAASKYCAGRNWIRLRRRGLVPSHFTRQTTGARYFFLLDRIAPAWSMLFTASLP